MVHPNEGTPDGIPLDWKISSFIPFPVGYSTDDHIREQINPAFFAEDHSHETCISLSAMLLSTRFAFSQMVIPQARPWEMFDAEILQLELDLNLIVAGIGKYNHWFSLLKSYFSYWTEFHGCSSYSVNQLEPWEDVKDVQFIQRFQSDISPFPCKGAEFSAVCSQLDDVLNHKDNDLSSLAKRINSFVENSLSPKKNSDLKKLLGFIRRVLGKNALSVTDPITTEEQLKMIKDNLFEAAEIVTNQFNSVDGNSVSWVNDMLKAIKTATGWVYASNNELKNDVLHRYTSKEKGCIAILKIRYRKEDQHYLSFSGFHDCENSYVLDHAGISMPLCQPVSAFESVCEHLSDAYQCNITYVPFTSEMRDHIERYTLRDRDVQNPSLYHPGYSHSTTMYIEFENTMFNTWPYPLSKHHYQVNYSCCERKILAYLKAEEIYPENSTAEWYIKFYPCIQCSHAIDLWRRDNHITKLVFTIPDLNS